MEKSIIKDSILVVSDLDGTLTEEHSSWQYVLEKLNLWNNQGEKNLELFLNKKIDYDKFIELDVALLKGISLKEYLTIIQSIKLRDGLVELFNYLENLHTTNIIVSSGLMDLATHIGTVIPISQIYANILNHDNEILTGKYEKKVGWNDKKYIMERLKELNPDSFIISFGDTLADLPLIELSDLSFSCFSYSEELNQSANFQISNLLDAIKLIKHSLG